MGDLVILVLILLVIFLLYGYGIYSYRKYRYRMVVEDDEIVLITLFKKIRVPFNSIEKIDLIGRLYAGYYASLEITYFHHDKKHLAEVPVSVVLFGPTYKVQLGEKKETLQKLVSKIPKERINPLLFELLSKKEMNFSKISKAIGAAFYKVRLK